MLFGTILGYPRLGPRRELRDYLYSYWQGKISEEVLEEKTRLLREETHRRLILLGLSAENYSIPESFSYYDHVLDAAVHVGAVPSRFSWLLNDGIVDLNAYFTLARGDRSLAPLESLRYFGSSYHYLVPEIDGNTHFALTSHRVITQFEQAKQAGVNVRPTILGPVSLLMMSRSHGPNAINPIERLQDLVPVYSELFEKLYNSGCKFVQVDEPAVTHNTFGIQKSQELLVDAYKFLSSRKLRPEILVAMSYGNAADQVDALATTGVEAMAFNLIDGAVPFANPSLADKALFGGVIDGRNIWRGDLAAAYYKLERLRELSGNVVASTSASLFHLPLSLDTEDLGDHLKEWLAFADEKVRQVMILARGLEYGVGCIYEHLDSAANSLSDRMTTPGVRVEEVRQALQDLGESDFCRPPREQQQGCNHASLPILPMVGIGEFSDGTPFVNNDGIPNNNPQAAISFQEDLDILAVQRLGDIDPIQRFASRMHGFAITHNGWVQSIGPHSVCPPILWGDVSRITPMSSWIEYTQTLTEKSVKPVLPGPLTLLMSCFVREDQPFQETAQQIAIAIRDDIADLQRSGIRAIQIDEPALEEFLSIYDNARYCAPQVFRLATSSAKPEVQIHLHLRPPNLVETIDIINDLDADVISAEIVPYTFGLPAQKCLMEIRRRIPLCLYFHDANFSRMPSVDECRYLIDTLVRDVDGATLAKQFDDMHIAGFTAGCAFTAINPRDICVPRADDAGIPSLGSGADHALERQKATYIPGGIHNLWIGLIYSHSGYNAFVYDSAYMRDIYIGNELQFVKNMTQAVLLLRKEFTSPQKALSA
ncbi:5-methyltetrahydropteroyltriglutamate--homocysteine S-methyltransferase [Tropheryma whipplei]|uniref:5-methyltetrahydropteroyltriglutamate-- homocysteine S-methyltransferase n=1 Tax=Tropheryma whipplei TaxID=2039 RepID=UPI0004B6B9EE|nr:5-methyltetrahydropteroyltriglutamate--homocysteine S-methyltransferase [Tropheryma whipplei]MCO8190519.1 5-methyltetrahydropteroyltriglutamate--homocysteine S-methyltransferase [Tropheryma whipplei]